MSHRLALSLALILSMPLSVPAYALTSLISNINRDLPLSMEDARSIEAGSLQLQAVTRYARTHEGSDQYFLSPQLQYGFSPRGFAQISTTEILGSEPKSGTSDLTLAGFYSLIPELKNPFKLALYTQLELPTGPSSSGLQSEVGVFATESLDKLEKNEIHLNLYWIHATNPSENELRHSYRVILGYTNAISTKLIFLSDAVREQGPDWNQFSNTLETGLLYSSSSTQTFGIGIGAGIGEESQKFRVTLAYQYAFGS
jgi:hypothetical protein